MTHLTYSFYVKIVRRVQFMVPQDDLTVQDYHHGVVVGHHD